MGAWIETALARPDSFGEGVAPYMGAWIETRAGLKSEFDRVCRTLYGCVD